MSGERFSRRYGHGRSEIKISIRADAPREVREAILQIAHSELNLRPKALRSILCAVLRCLPSQDNWSEYPNVWEECQYLILECHWYEVYDFVEALHRYLADSQGQGAAKRWEELVNDYFLETGVGWRLVDGLLESRGPEAFETTVHSAVHVLDDSGLRTASQEIHEALRDLSRRPEPDLTGAVQHAMAALECTVREAVGNPRATLGEILNRYPGLFPRPLDEALTKLWGYASETGRHLREGRLPTRAEAELTVGVAASASVYLTSKIRNGNGS